MAIKVLCCFTIYMSSIIGRSHVSERFSNKTIFNLLMRLIFCYVDIIIS